MPHDSIKSLQTHLHDVNDGEKASPTQTGLPSRTVVPIGENAAAVRASFEAGSAEQSVAFRFYALAATV